MTNAERSQHARALARQFAATLSHLRSAWGVEYVGLHGPDIRMPPRQAVPDMRHVERSSPAANPETDRSVGSSVHKPDRLRVQAEQWSAAQKLEYLRHKNLGDCRRCALCQARRNIVFGVGNPEASMMFVGEAPGADEDVRGEPFVGRAGQRLDRWIEAIGLRREDVYIANVLKCRPPKNRDPRPEEVDKCSPFLKAQIRAIAPRVIVALGRHAGMLLSSREDLSLRAMRMDRLTYDASGPKEAPGTRAIPLIVTYHPAYVLRQEGAGATPSSSSSSPEGLVMEDLRRAVQIAHGT